MCAKEADSAVGPIAKHLGELLTQRGLTLAVAESCTGGLISHSITNIPGASNYFLMGVVAYSNEAKEKLLGVERPLLDNFGAVSRDVALAMARGIRNTAHTDVGVGVTGIAGPQGGTPEKPVGLVFIAVVTAELERVERHIFAGDRSAIKRQAADAALALILDVLHA
jgi:PncC family amidohydrolase